MPAGWLRERVSLQERDPNAAKNSYNEPPDTWRDLLTSEPASVYALGGREFTAAQQTQASITHRIIIRTPATVVVQQDHRFTWVETLLNGSEVTHYLDIKHVIPLQNRRGYTECLCTEHVNG